MINVNQITSQLAKMPDQALQKYAALNKNDPYILALAVAESNRRKEMRQASQGAQGMMPQPKVVDQAVQGMAPAAPMAPAGPAQPMPEDMGIGRLPAGDMNFADGGIVAFADGGSVSPALLAQYNKEAEEMGYGQRMQFSPEIRAIKDQIESAKSSSYLQQEQQRMLAGSKGLGSFGPQLQTGAAPTVVSNVPAGGPTLPRGIAGSRSYPDAAPAVDAGKAAAPKATPAAALNPRAPGAASAPGAAPAETKDAIGLDALIKDFTRSTDLAQGALRNQRVGLAAQLEQEAKGAQEEGEQRRAARGDVYKAREERLAAREGELAGMKDKHLGLALLQAGAAMMTTPGNLGMALGKGVQVGSERYMAGIDKINAAKEKFAEARDRLDDLRLNRDDMNEREIRDENRAIRNARIQGQQLLTEGATKDLEMNTANMREFFKAGAENILTDKRIKSAENISANEIAARKAIAAMPGAQERLANLLGGGDIERGLIRFTEIQAGKFNPQSAYAEYLSKRKEGETALSPVEFMNALRSISALQAGVPGASNKPTGKVLE